MLLWLMMAPSSGKGIGGMLGSQLVKNLAIFCRTPDPLYLYSAWYCCSPWVTSGRPFLHLLVGPCQGHLNCG